MESMTDNGVADRAVMWLIEVAEQSSEMLRSKVSEVATYRIALADAIRRPMGVIPDSAVGLITNDELDEAELRRTRKIDTAVAKGGNETF